MIDFAAGTAFLHLPSVAIAAWTDAGDAT
jgi:hypothetical protein